PSTTSVQKTVVTNQTTVTFDWHAVESDDYKKYIANLRSVGCPEETIKDIILADVNKLFADKKKAGKKPAKPFKYWETGMAQMLGIITDEAEDTKKKELAAEKKALIKDLLGIEVDEKADVLATLLNPLERLLDFLPSDKQTKVMELMQNFQTKQVKAMGKGSPDEVDLKEMQKAQKEMETEMSKIMTPSEFEDYQLRLSNTAMMMRMQLDGFNPSEQEFKEIFKLQKGFDDDFSPFGAMGMSKEDKAKREAAQKELDKNIKNLLGDARATDYQREKDFEWKSITKVTNRENLPKEAAVKVYDMKKIAQDEANKVRSNNDLTQEQKTEALKAMRAETVRSLTETLGQKGYDSYKNNAYWLNNIHQE
ncbi:MAG: hypothetical protein JWM04_539, partial [Verrucomicrobiales bacterium]|nr:hypothetical protein [Verrucomicrobiales bacterium]